MNKFIFCLLIAAALLVSIGLSPTAEARRNDLTNVPLSVKPRPVPTTIEILTLSQMEVFIKCELGYVPTESCPDQTAINVHAAADGPEGEEPEIKYTVSGGRIVGKGADIQWDFSDEKKAGYYSLTVEFVGFDNKKKTETQTITLRDCDCPNDPDNSNQPEILNPPPTPTPLAAIERIELDRKEVMIPCELNGNVDESRVCGYKENGLVSIKTIVNKTKKDIPLIYKYKVSGGRIVGQGGKVFWDLKGIRPGTYTITAAIDDGRGLSDETDPQEVNVVECCCLYCACPTLDVTGGGNVKAGETVSFKANVIGGTATDIAYDWTISQGEIIEGQGTSEIKVKTTPEMIGIVTATVEIGGDGFCAECMRTDSETATIIK